ncbi:MAG: hypothetical protein C4318_00090 [Acidimicrobiia bacterium]
MFLLTLGVVLAAVSSVLFNFGLVLQKQGAREQKGLRRLSFNWIKGYLTSKRWLAGTSITICGYASELVAFSIAPFALLQPVYTAGLSTLAVFSVLVAKERFSRLEWTGVIMAVAGASMVVATARPDVDMVAFDKIAWGRLETVLLSSAVVSIALFLVGMRLAERSEVVLGLASGVAFTGAEVLTKAIGIEIAHGPHRMSISLLAQPHTWSIAAGLLFFGILGTYFLQVGFEHGRALIVGGVMGLSADMLPLLSGVAVFGEKLAPGVILGTLRISGIMLALLGASLVAFSEKTQHLVDVLSSGAVDGEEDRVEGEDNLKDLEVSIHSTVARNPEVESGSRETLDL